MAKFRICGAEGSSYKEVRELTVVKSKRIDYLFRCFKSVGAKPVISSPTALTGLPQSGPTDQEN